jgi:DNA mismatch repair protein MutS
MDKTQYTPMMQHYLQLKEQNPDAILFYRLGDFYEMFFEDAKTASRELDLVLTARACGNNEKAPMCGLPFHASEGYISRLVKKGYKVAICEQLSEPNKKGLMDRDIIRIVTPGTYMDEIETKSSQYLCAVSVSGWNLACIYCEMSTGQLFWQTSDKTLAGLFALLNEADTVELVSDNLPAAWMQTLQEAGIMTTIQEAKPLEESQKALFPDAAPLQNAGAVLMAYLEHTQKQKAVHFLPARHLHETGSMILDQNTRRHLELVSTNSTAAKAQSLWQFLDKCRTAMGSRMLRRWIEAPLCQEEAILARQDQVQTLINQFLLREQLGQDLESVHDLERLASRIAVKSAGPRDLARLRETLAVLPALKEHASSIDKMWQTLWTGEELCALLQRALVSDPPANVKDGDFFRPGWNARLDELTDLAQSGNDWILQLEAQEREKTGIKSLKIGYNRVFGYYIEVRNPNLNLVKPEYGYIQKQTLANAVRFVTPALKDKEEQILHAQEEKSALEQTLFQELLARIQEDFMGLHEAAASAAQIDCLLALAQCAVQYNYVRPTFAPGSVHVEEGRHPILEQRLSKFVSNDWVMESGTNVQLITGPNMGGKSTYMRQNALIAVMAQIGSFVPARSAVLPLFDRIFTRIGASDDQLKGQSTFMTEMLEANAALTEATAHSLVLFDEIGRGTATYDGMALAQSILEYLTSAVGACTLFSTHYHELTELEKDNPGIQNMHADVRERKENIEFLYRILPGKADKSYGIHVARIAGLPETVLDRANALLKELEENQDKERWQPSLFVMDRPDPKAVQVFNRVKQLDPDVLSARDALDFLYDLKTMTGD